MGYPDVSSFAFIVVFLITIITIRPGSEEGNQLLKYFWVLFFPSRLVVFGIYGDHVAVALILSLTSLFFVIQLYTLRNGIELICNYMKLKSEILYYINIKIHQLLVGVD